MSLKEAIRPLVPDWALAGFHRARASVAAYRYGLPSRKLQVFGITGTNGKTSTAFFLHSILEASRRKTGLATTVRFNDGNGMIVNKKKMTTIEPFQLQKLLAKMVKNQAKAAVLEVTSHALAQHRVSRIAFDTVVFTNLSREHIGEGIFHHNMEQYRQMKERLFAKPHRVSVINADDPAAPSFAQYPATRKVFYSVNKTDVDLFAADVKTQKEGMSFKLNWADKSVKVNLKLAGVFNIENALAAAGAALGSNIDLDVIVEGLENLTHVPGRVESIDEGQNFSVMIDYAHSPDALKRLFEAVKPTVRGRLIHVGGATGNRDKQKRRILGGLAANFADVVVVTNEDPDNEDPEKIIDEVVAGVMSGAKKFKQGETFFRLTNRAEAIQKAIKIAQPDDLVLITGKGDESSMIVKGKLVPYSDRQVVTKALKQR
ncbi:UDP-N-acetylmuramoyl-L-alanyl-D-glutamate--2,6-diaminopimelate ligase [Candidatus Berkelbacteria bacterium]|nr:UDP-N-acetylmuramoyl-L-alanyl-D-glutamate--2,6-diaminopimelate ligase [Candidatus Berkelbacteria bacterium]